MCKYPRIRAYCYRLGIATEAQAAAMQNLAREIHRHLIDDLPFVTPVVTPLTPNPSL